MTRPRRRTAWLAPLALVVLVLLVAGASVLVLRTPPGRPAADVVPAVRGTVTRGLPAAGVVVGARQVGVSFPAADGVVARLDVRPGAVVREGDELGALDDAVPRARVTAAQARLDADTRDLDAARGRGTDPAAEVAVARLEAAVAGDRADRLTAQRDVDATVLRASISGTVTTLAALPGDRVAAPGAVVVTLTDLADLVLRVRVPAAEVARLTGGRPAAATIDGVGVVGASVATVAAAPDPDGAYRVDLRVAPSTPGLRAGQAVDATIVTARAANVLVVPRAAVRGSAAGPTVLVREPGGDRVVAVGIGLVGEDQVEITRGLSAGRLVVVPRDPVPAALAPPAVSP